MLTDTDVESPRGLAAIRTARLPKSRRGKKPTSTERLMPFRAIEGPLLRCADGSTIVYLTYPGDNLSLKDEAQRARYAARNAQVLSGIDAQKIGIWIVPVQVSSKENLAMCDERIRRERAYLAKAGTAPGTEPRRASLRILESRLRPTLQEASVSAGEVSVTTYIGLKFSHASDREILNAVGNFRSEMRKQVKRRPELLGRYEILDFIDLYIKGSVPIGQRAMGAQMIMPSMEVR